MTPTLRTTDPRAFDALVAERVMGWTPGSGRTYDPVWVDAEGKCVDGYFFAPSKCAKADYRVIEQVRKVWALDQQIQFANALSKTYAEREGEGAFSGEVGMLSHTLNYAVGDFAEAALRVVMEKGQ